MNDSLYKTSRKEFLKIIKLYREYLDLYRFFNQGSHEGAVPFDEFYWAHQFEYKDIYSSRNIY